MDAADLRMFEAVARLGGMNRAAAELNTVQSNVTARIRQLEGELGTRLFQRHARGATLTPAGRRLLPYARKIGRLLEDARRAVRDDGTPTGLLTIGSLETTAALRLSPLLTAYAASHPAVDLVLRTGTTCELVEDVLAHRLEGAFVCGPVNRSDLENEVVFREELAILTAPFVRSLDGLVNRLEPRIVVLRAGCSYRQRLEEILARRGIVNLRRLEFGTLEAIIGCVGAGLGITLLPKSLIGKVWREGRVAVHELPAAEAEVETVFIRRRDTFASSALTAFMELARPSQAKVRAAE
ncbi:MAG TPA: LysR substrate-binding domain-containing protein [Alphaproteobacteria bacterium]|nr:LysR substrate-binding domain-containing protein [Alphaproteobacteria bacterium]